MLSQIILFLWPINVSLPTHISPLLISQKHSCVVKTSRIREECVRALSFNVPTSYVRTRVESLVARVLTFIVSTVIQARGPRLHQGSGPTTSRGPGSFFSLARCGSSRLLLSFLVAFEFSPSFFPKRASSFSFLSHLQRAGNVEAVSAPVQVFINTHVRPPNRDRKLHRIHTLSRYDVLGTSFGSSPSLLYRVTSFKCALPRKTRIYSRKILDRPHYFHHFTIFPFFISNN